MRPGSNGTAPSMRACLAFAAAVLEAAGCPAEPGQQIRMVIEAPDGHALSYTGPACRPEDEDAPPRPRRRPPGAPEEWEYFSPLEQAIIKATPAEGWTPASEIARAIGEELTGGLKATLHNLAARRVLLSAGGKGYRLNLPGGPAGTPGAPER